jgi:hypothetical protein
MEFPMIDPADLAPITAALDRLDMRLTAIEAELAARRGGMNSTPEPPEAPLTFVRGKPNAPPHGEDIQ